MCECLDYDDGTRHTCEACVGDLETMREMLAAAERERDEWRKTHEIASLRADNEARRADAAERRAEEAEAKYAHIADGYIAAQKLLDDERERVDKWIAYTEQLKEEKGLLHESLNGCAEKLASERAARERAERERDEAICKLQETVAKVAENRLDGYRALGQRALDNEVAAEGWRLKAIAAESRAARAGAEIERLREALAREAFWLESQRFDRTPPSVFEARAASIRAALAEIGGER